MFVTHQFLCACRDSFAAIRPKGGLIDTYRSNLKQLRNVRRYRFLSGLSEGSEGTRNPKTLEVRSRRTSAANDQECNKTRPGAGVVALLGTSIASGQKSDDTLARGFQQPPGSAKPRVWWHWMNGNVTKEGIKADLEWMNRVGIGGFQNFDASLGTPQIVQKRLIYMTPEWKDAFRYATTLADQLGLEMGVASSAGWNLSGGSWILPEQAMKKFVWSETEINGGEAFHGVLKRPPSNAGPFQNFPLGATAPEFYRHSASIAYRLPPNDTPPHDLPRIASSGGQSDLATLTDGDLAKATLLPAAPDRKSVVE